MANLFHETHSTLYHALSRIINRIYAGERYRCSDILDELHAAVLLETDPADISAEEEEDLTDSLFLFDSPDMSAEAKLFYHAPVPALPSITELRWLKSMLTDEAADFLLEPALRQKLLAKLKDVAVLPVSEIWDKKKQVGDDLHAEPFHTHLKTIWKALRERKQLHYVNLDSQGQRHEYTQEPCRLEYDAAENRYRLIFWNRTENRAVCVIVNRLLDLSIADKAIAPDIETLFRQFLDEHKQSFTLRLRKKNNAVDRCFSIFSSYDKEAYMENDGTYVITVYHYSFDEEPLLRKILSLGSAATVLAPAELQKEISERLKGAWEKNSV